MSQSQIGRRTVAKGAAWAIPAVAIAAPAPAMAASQTVTTASVCKIFEGSGNANGQTTNVYFQLGTNDGTAIKAGTKFVFKVTLDSSTYGTASGAPQSSYGSWMTGVVSDVATSGTTTTFTYTITVTADNSASGNCEAYLYWDNSGSSSGHMAPNTTVTIAGSGTPVSGNGQAKAGTLSFNTGVRWESSVNDPSHLKPVNFLSKDGAIQTCYPTVQFSRIYTNYNHDAQICVNGGSCQYATPASGTAQMTTPGVC